MSMITRLLARLHRVFNKDPQAVPVITISLPVACRITLANMMLTLSTACGNASFDLSSGSVNDLVENINANTSINYFSKFTDLTWVSNTSLHYIKSKIGPNGEDALQLVSELGVPSPFFISNIAGSSNMQNNTLLSLSMIVKSDDGNIYYSIAMNDRQGGITGALFHLDTGEVSDILKTATSDDPTMESLGNGWWLCKINNFDIGVGSNNVTVISGHSNIFGDYGTAYIVTPMVLIASPVATLLRSDFSSHLSSGLQEVSAYETNELIEIAYPTNLLYNEFQVHARELQNQAARVKAIPKQMAMTTSDGEWTDYWGSFLNVPRLDGESDQAYIERAIYTVLRPNQNNVALEQIVRDALGIDIVIDDAEDHLDRIPVEQQDFAPGRFLLEIAHAADLTTEEKNALQDKIVAILKKYKASGTELLLSTSKLLEIWAEIVAAGEVMELLTTMTMADELEPGPLKCGAGWKCGTPGLKCGQNEPMLEQAVVTVLVAADNSIVSVETYGG